MDILNQLCIIYLMYIKDTKIRKLTRTYVNVREIKLSVA